MWKRLLYSKHNFLGEISDFFGKGSSFNAEISDNEKCSEPVGERLNYFQIIRDSPNSFCIKGYRVPSESAIFDQIWIFALILSSWCDR